MKTVKYYQEVQELVLTLRYKNYTKFMQDLENLVSQNEEHDELVFLLGHYAYNLGNYKLALEYFRTAWDLNKTVQEYADAISITYISLNDKDKALSFSNTSKFLKPHEHVTHLIDTSIMNYTGLKDDSNIKDSLREILRNFQTGHYYSCIDIAMKIIDSANDNPKLFLYLGKSYYNLSQYNLAYEALKISYDNTDDNYEQLKLLMELSLKLGKIDSLHSYMKEFSHIENLSLDNKIQTHIFNHYMTKDPKISEKIENLTKDKKPIRENEINNNSFICNIGIIINNRMDPEYLSALLSFIATPDNFSTTIYDIDSQNSKTKALFERNNCNYKNLYRENYQSSAMVIRGEGLDVLIDATYESFENSTLIYAYDNIVKCKVSLFDVEVKPQSNKILLSDIKKIIDNENILKMDSFISFERPIYERYAQAPLISTNILTVGIIADKRNTSSDFIDHATDILQSSDNIRLIFGYKDSIDPHYKRELITHFDKLNLTDRIFFLEQNDENNLNLKDEFFGYIDVLLNGSKVYPEALAISLYMGVPVYYMRTGLSNDSLALSILSTFGEYDEYIYDDNSKCVKDIIAMANDPEKLMSVRKTLIDYMPETLLFNKEASVMLFYTNIVHLLKYKEESEK